MDLEPEDRESLFAKEIALAASRQTRKTPRCPEEETLRSLERGRLMEPEAGRIMAHIAFCTYCRGVYNELVHAGNLAREIASLPPSSGGIEPLRALLSRRNARLAGVAAFACLLAFAFYRIGITVSSTNIALMEARVAQAQKEQQALASQLQEARQARSTDIRTQEAAARQKQVAEQQLKQLRAHQLLTQQQLQAVKRQLAQAGNKQPRVARAPVATQDHGQILLEWQQRAIQELETGPVMSDAQTASFPIHLISPVKMVVLGRRTTFVWEALPKDVTYTVRVSKPDGDTVYTSEPVRGTTMTVPLPPNSPRVPHYSWMVTASTGEESCGERFFVLKSSRK